MTFLFRSATAFLPISPDIGALTQNKGKDKALSPRNDALGSEEILSQLATWAAEKEGNSIRVAVTGLANVIAILCCVPLTFTSFTGWKEFISE